MSIEYETDATVELTYRATDVLAHNASFDDNTAVAHDARNLEAVFRGDICEANDCMATVDGEIVKPVTLESAAVLRQKIGCTACTNDCKVFRTQPNRLGTEAAFELNRIVEDRESSLR